MHVGALAHDASLAERHDVLAVRNVGLDRAVERFGSRNITGSSSRIAAIRRPLVSAGVDGITTFSPGVWQK